MTFGWFFFNYSTNEISLILNNYTIENNKEITIKTVKSGTETYFKIDFPSNGAPEIDIEYTSAISNQIFSYNGISSNKANTYYLCPESTSKTLSQIKIRSSYKDKKGRWNSVLTYFDATEKIQSDIELAIFGKSVAVTITNNSLFIP